MEDKIYRQELNRIFQGILHAFDNVDPDVAEAELDQGTLTILVRGKKTILSPQPPVKQIWLAVASEGIALHFSKDPTSGAWMDDKGQGHELYAFTESVLKKLTGQPIKLQA